MDSGVPSPRLGWGAQTTAHRGSEKPLALLQFKLFQLSKNAQVGKHDNQLLTTTPHRLHEDG